jgi:hypothetical protein
MSNEENDMEAEYIYLGTYSPYETRQLLDAFMKAGIRCDASVANRPVPDGRNGRYGVDAGVSIAVHMDDLEKALQMRAGIFKIQV